MTELRIAVPAQLEDALAWRVKDGDFADANQYATDLLQRHLERSAEECEWLRAEIQAGIDSGMLDQTVDEIFAELAAEFSGDA